MRGRKLVELALAKTSDEQGQTNNQQREKRFTRPDAKRRISFSEGTGTEEQLSLDTNQRCLPTYNVDRAAVRTRDYKSTKHQIRTDDFERVQRWLNDISPPTPVRKRSLSSSHEHAKNKKRLTDVNLETDDTSSDCPPEAEHPSHNTVHASVHANASLNVTNSETDRVVDGTDTGNHNAATILTAHPEASLNDATEETPNIENENVLSGQISEPSQVPVPKIAPASFVQSPFNGTGDLPLVENDSSPHLGIFMEVPNEIDAELFSIRSLTPDRFIFADDVVEAPATTPGENVGEDPVFVSPDRCANSVPTSSDRLALISPDSTTSSRKRRRNPENWECNRRKEAKNLGIEYVTPDGTVRPGAKMRPPCACKYDCIHRISEEDRGAEFKRFWALGCHDRQWAYIRSQSEAVPTKARKVTNPTNAPEERNGSEERVDIEEEDEEDAVEGKNENEGKKKRSVARKYFFYVKGQKVKVCKQMFMTTLGIWDCWIDSAYNHVNPEKGFTASPGKRGLHSNHRKKTTDKIVLNVKEHVNTFPRVPSHYCRVRSKRQYLERGLSLRKMAKLYSQWAKTKGLPRGDVATQRQYIDIVNTHFNIGFHKPRKDQCNLCCLMNSKHNPKELLQRYQEKYEAHVRNKQKGKLKKAQDKVEAQKKNHVAMCTFDLQKQLSCPKSEASSFFYKSKLNVFNFTVFNSKRRLGTCFLWHEGEGKRGSAEISSSLLQYFTDLVASGVTDIRLYSDNCAGQNKNRFLFSMYVFVAVKFSIQITHRYLEPGHTQMEVDSIHGRIETSTKLIDIFDFDGWVNAIEEAKEALPKYEVRKLKRTNIYQFEDLVSKQNWEKDSKGKVITWRKVREFHVNGDEGGKVRMRYEYDGDEIILNTKKVGHPVNLKTYKPPIAHKKEELALTARKKQDLLSLCSDFSIPEEKQGFIRSILDSTYDVEEEEFTDPEFDSDEELCEGDKLSVDKETSRGQNKGQEEKDE